MAIEPIAFSLLQIEYEWGTPRKIRVQEHSLKVKGAGTPEIETKGAGTPEIETEGAGTPADTARETRKLSGTGMPTI